MGGRMMQSPTRGEKIKSHLKRKKRSQQWLANKMEVSEAQVTRICQGQDLTMTEVGLLARHLEIPIRYLFDWSPELPYPWRLSDMNHDLVVEVLAWMTTQTEDEWKAWHSLMLKEWAKRDLVSQRKNIREALRAWIIDDGGLNRPITDLVAPIDRSNLDVVFTGAP
jgi:hypothetical protein